MRKHSILSSILLSFCALTPSAHAAYVVKDGSIVNLEQVATLPVEEHYNLGVDAYNKSDWCSAIQHFKIITCSFRDDPIVHDCYFYLAVAYFYAGEMDFANDAITAYLKHQSNARLFEQAIEVKFCIAEQLRGGAKIRFFGTKQLPKLASGRSLALTIYDEVIAALPAHDLAAQALYYKGMLLWEDECYRESIDAFQTLIRRFPKHELAPEAYLAIADVYVEQSYAEFQNPDLLALAGINLRKFSQNFPRDERVALVEERFQWMKESYAEGLYEIGRFYERKGAPSASAIYYHKAINDYPDTEVAEFCKVRLVRLNFYHPESCETITEEEAKAESATS